MSTISISGGEYGILAGSQQYSASRIQIYGSKKCIGLIWNWVWVSSATFSIFLSVSNKRSDSRGHIFAWSAAEWVLT